MGIVSSTRKGQELKVVFNDDTLLITPDNGKEIAFPLLWHPQLKNATEEEKRDWYLSKDGRRLIWEKLGVEISF